MIKLLSPLSRVDEVEDLIAAGADEFYCGVLPEEWNSTYSVSASINRRQEDNSILGTSPHFKCFEDLKTSIALAHAHNVPVMLTLNEHYYSHGQYDYLLCYIEEALKAEVDALIVGDVGLMAMLKEKQISIPLHMSTAGTAFNTETVRFYRDLGASRIILPRHLTIAEIESLAHGVSGIELEVFILNSRCANVDGFCTFQHGLADLFTDEETRKSYFNACMLPYNVAVYGDGETVIDPETKEQIPWERQLIWSALHIDDRPCGACALYEFEQIGLYGVKIVGRQNTKGKKIKDLTFLRTLRTFLSDRHPDQETFRKFSRDLYQQTYQWPCLVFKCYYPSVLLK